MALKAPLCSKWHVTTNTAKSHIGLFMFIDIVYVGCLCMKYICIMCCLRSVICIIKWNSKSLQVDLLPSALSIYIFLQTNKQKEEEKRSILMDESDLTQTCPSQNVVQYVTGGTVNLSPLTGEQSFQLLDQCLYTEVDQKLISGSGKCQSSWCVVLEHPNWGFWHSCELLLLSCYVETIFPYNKC